MKTLIVEDDFTSRQVLLGLLKDYGQCDVAVDGREALEAVARGLRIKEPYDLICLDIMMPELDGHAVLRAVRELEQELGAQAARIVMTSALEDPKNVLGAFQSGCEAYLEKPIDKERLLLELKKLRLVS